jgi:hypothetical protein
MSFLPGNAVLNYEPGVTMIADDPSGENYFVRAKFAQIKLCAATGAAIHLSHCFGFGAPGSKAEALQVSEFRILSAGFSEVLGAQGNPALIPTGGPDNQDSRSSVVTSKTRPHLYLN